jgi:uncharacterized SAM-binding protein YcdF (DUF218 family)
MGRFVLGFAIGFAAALGLLAGVGHFLRVSDAPGAADVIVAVSGDTGARARTAAALFKSGYAPLIIFSGGTEDFDFPDMRATSSAEIMRDQAVAAGVPASAILVEPRARSTAENARFVRDLMRERNLRTALLVTSPYHQRRAALEFTRAFDGTGLSFLNVPVDGIGWDPTFWWTRPELVRLTVTELAKLSLAYISR